MIKMKPQVVDGNLIAPNQRIAQVAIAHIFNWSCLRGCLRLQSYRIIDTCKHFFF